MKILPSVAFNDFSGSAGNVTARKTGDKTYLSTRTKHSKKKTTYQATTRCRFADTTRGYSKITEEQRQGWISLAKNLGTYHTSTGNTSITGHNLFVAINSYRKICGKPKTAIAPSQLRASDYIRLDDWWLSPEHIVFTGLGERENPNEVLYVEMYPAQSPAENRCWDKTVLVAIIPSTDWGDIDLTRAFIEKFGSPLTIGQKVFIKICWIDSECGYIKYYTLIVREAQEASIERNVQYFPRAKITFDQLYYNKEAFLIERFDFELSPSPKLTSNEITISHDQEELIVHFGIDTPEQMDVMDIGHSFQYARDTSAYQVILVELQILTGYNKRIEINSRSIMYFQNRTEFFGTYFLTY
jgi:hypothetical protein